MAGDSFGAYGGAVDGAGNLYFSPLGGFGSGLLARIDRETLTYDIWTIPSGVAPYGITVDHKGRVWLASNFGSIAGRFDPTTETWGVVQGIGGGSQGSPPDASALSTPKSSQNYCVRSLQRRNRVNH